MPIIPAPTPVASNDTAFDATLTVAGTAQDLVVAPAGEKIRSFELRNEGPGNAFIEATGPATVTSFKVKNGETYSKDGISIDKLSFIGDPSKKPEVSGVAWSS